MKSFLRCLPVLIVFLGGCSNKPRATETSAPVKDERAPDVYRVDFDTSKGLLVVEVTRAWSPRGADRFYTLVKQGFYDGARFFRVIPGFMVQFGISGAPEVNRKWKNTEIEDDPVTQSNQPGYVSFATSGPRSRTTQVFINYGKNDRLDSSGFSPFGKVVSGMSVIEQFYSGYGEGAPSGSGPAQDRAESEGNAYLEREFPRLDYIKTARIAN